MYWVVFDEGLSCLRNWQSVAVITSESDSMRCPGCGRSVQQEDYCSKCGTKIVAAHDDVKDSHPVESRSARGRREPVDEVVLWKGSFSWKGLLREFAVCALATVGLAWLKLNFSDPPIQQYAIPAIVLVWCALLLWLLYQKLNVSYQLTNQRLIHERGILYRRVNRIETIDIDDIGYEQGLIERAIGVGKIRVSSSDVSHRRGLMLVGINHPREVSELIEKARRDERMRYGLHVEAV